MKLFQSKKDLTDRVLKDATYDLLVDTLKSVLERRVYTNGDYESEKVEDFEKTLSMNRMEVAMVLDYIKKVGTYGNTDT